MKDFSYLSVVVLGDKKGDHLIYSRIDLKRPVIITADAEVPVFIIRNNIRTLGLSPDQYLEILKNA